jgi:hypothetical protein
MMSTDDKDSLTTDIIARLRQEGSFPPYYGVPAIQNDAADEIERLRAENERLRAALDILQAAMVAKKPIPMPFKIAINQARAALPKGENDD